MRQRLFLLEDYIHQEQFTGYDPYDCLTSPLFSLSLLRNNRTLRLGAQQLLRRFPFNIRPLLQIPKGKNPVTYGLCLNAYSRMVSLFPEKTDFYRRQASVCLEELARLRSPGYSGACWGYDFDWEARYATIPAYTPTIVATGIIADGLFRAHQIFSDNEARLLLVEIGPFLRTDLQRTWEGDTFCYSYSPHDHQAVFNATLKGARLLCQIHTITQDASLLGEAKATVQYVVRQQKPDGSWSYSKGDSRSWTDNFHTGYVLDCLDEYSKLSGDTTITRNVERGFSFYREHFFTAEGAPRYFRDQTYPVDATAAAQSILTLVRFGDRSMATMVAQWAIRNLQDPRGYFYYRRYRHYTNRISYMRWSNAWMYLALAALEEDYHALV
jgi:hypothetical protein